MEFIESEILELKSRFTDEIKKTIIAFANCGGGKVYIGVNDGGEVVGLDDADDVCLRLVAAAKNAIRPDIIMSISVAKERICGKDVVVASVNRGVSTPYYLADKGLKPTGVFVRSGSSTIMASEENIRRMIKETDGEKFVLGRSFEQELSFEKAERAFKLAGVRFSKSEKITLGIIRNDGEYSNLGLLLSDNCRHTIKAAIFQGTSKAVFKDRKEFGGSLFSQLEGAFEYIDLYNKTAAVFTGLRRVDIRDYPQAAVREALLNAIVHREYSYSGSILVNLYDDRLEVVSIGGIVSGLTLDDIKNGVSQTRNEKLANVFYRLKYVEAYGTGLPRIFEGYKNFRLQPSISVTADSFCISLPSMNYEAKAENNQAEQPISGSIGRKPIYEGSGSLELLKGGGFGTLKEGRIRSGKGFDFSKEEKTQNGKIFEPKDNQAGQRQAEEKYQTTNSNNAKVNYENGVIFEFRDDSETETSSIENRQEIRIVSGKQEQNILAFIKESGTITREELMNEFNIGATRSYNILTYLVKIKKLKETKDGKKKNYSIF